MDNERFEKIARNPSRTREELENMKRNALANGKTELAHVAEEILRERFPVKTKKASGATATRAVFRDRSETFSTGKEAYLWLVEQFKSYCPAILEQYDALHERARSNGRRFARSPRALFPPGSKRAGNSSYYSALSGGWYADTNINHQDKFSALLQLGYVAKLDYPMDWTFRVQGGTQELAAQQEMVVMANEMLNELLIFK
jgi:hypothetical protein